MWLGGLGQEVGHSVQVENTLGWRGVKFKKRKLKINQKNNMEEKKCDCKLGQCSCKNDYIEEYYSNGQVMHKGLYINGKRYGLWESYYENGKLDYKTTYVNGNRNGLSEYYKNGQLWIKGTYVNEKKYGLWEYYDDDGKIESIGKYFFDFPCGIWKSYCNGKLKEKRFILFTFFIWKKKYKNG